MQRVFQVELEDASAAKRQKTIQACQRCRDLKKRCSAPSDFFSCRRCEMDGVRCSFQVGFPSPLSLESNPLDTYSDSTTTSNVDSFANGNGSTNAAIVGTVPFDRSHTTGPYPSMRDALCLTSSSKVSQEAPSLSKTPTRDADALRPITNDTKPSKASELRYSTMLELLQHPGNRQGWWEAKLIGDSNPLSALLRKDIKHRIVTRMCDFRAPEPDWEQFYASRNVESHKFQYLKSLGCFALPKVERIGHLLDIYFSRVHPILPIIDRAEFLSRFYGLGEPPPLVLLQAMILAASRYASRSSEDSTNEIRDECDKVHARVRALIDLDMANNRLAVLRASLIASFHWEGREGVNSAIDCLSLAVRIGQEMGLHRHQDPSRQQTGCEDVMSKRLWWCIYAFDRFNAAQEGTPFLINERDCDVDWLQPSELSDEDDITRQTTLLNISLSRIIEDAIRALYAPDIATDPSGLVASRDTLLSRLDGLSHLIDGTLGDGDVDNVGMQSFWCCILQIHLRAVRILVLRPFILQFDPALSLYSFRDMCRGTATDIQTLLCNLRSKSLLGYTWPFTVYALVNALLIFWYDISSPVGVSAETQRTARRHFVDIIELLKEIGNTWWAAAAKHKLSEALLRLADTLIHRKEGVASDFGRAAAPLEEPCPPTATGSDHGLIPGGHFYDQFPDGLDNIAFWESLGLDFENEVVGNVFSIF